MNASKKDIIDTIFKIVLATVLIIYSLVMILPLCWGLMTTFKSYREYLGIMQEPNVLGLPKKLVFDNYDLVFKYFSNPMSSVGEGLGFLSYFGTTPQYHEWNVNFLTIVINTIFYCFVGSLIQTITPAIMGYLCANYKNKLVDFINGLVIVVMVLPIIGNQAATITLLRNLNLYDNWIGNFIQKFHFAGTYFLVFQAFFRGLSNSYSEAAEIDGASQFTVMIKIYMPLAIKMISTIALILFVQCWNDFTTPLMYLPTKPTIAFIVYEISIRSSYNLVQPRLPINTPHRIAACMLVAIPIIIVFCFLKDKLMGNISMGGVKE